MATTAQDALDLAVQRASLNNADLIAPAQVVRYLSNAEKTVYRLAAKFNPSHFGTTGDTATRAAFGDSWNLRTAPGGIAANRKFVVKTIVGTVTNSGVNIAVGDELGWIDSRWVKYALVPRVYVEDGKLFGQGTELGADNSNMVTVVTVSFAILPTGPTALGQSMTTPDEWIDLVVLPLARIFAIRDNRLAEAQLIQEEFGNLKAEFTDHVGVYDGGAVRPLHSVPVATAVDSPAPRA